MSVALDWRAPANVRAIVTSIDDGNLAMHAGDAGATPSNRAKLVRKFALPADPVWLTQVHGDRVEIVGGQRPEKPEADAAYTREMDTPLAVMVADCLPVLLSSRSGEEIGVVHAGWRGLANGVIGRAVSVFSSRDIVAWLGPGIGPCHYQVDAAVRDHFPRAIGFEACEEAGHWMMDLKAIATEQLRRAGVGDVADSGICTGCDERFFSFRMDASCGRFAAVVWRIG